MLGLSLKVASPALVSKVDLTRQEERLTTALLDAGLFAGGSRALTHQGVYRAMSFYHPKCAGVLAVVLLDRNGEAAHILDGLTGESGFYYEGEHHVEFPYWSFMLGKLMGGAPVVMAYREAGFCAFHRVLAN